MGQAPQGREFRRRLRENPARWVQQDLGHFQVIPYLDYLRPIPYGYFDVNVDWIAGATDFYPPDYPAVLPPPIPNDLAGLSEERVALWLHDRQQEAFRQASEVYDLHRFVAVSAAVQVSFTEWLSMSAVVRDALVNEVNDMLRERERSARESRERLENQLKNRDASRLQFPHSPKLFTESYFSK